MKSKLFAHTVLAGLAVAMICFVSGAQAAEDYQTDLGPSPGGAAGRLTIQGRGWAVASLDGNKLSIHAAFAGLVTPATDAHLQLGVVMGAPGPVFQDLTISQATDGTASGSFTLTSAQIAALKSGKIYIQINSQKAPTGNLWGWLQPQHVTSAPDVPQEGEWYLPNLLN